MQLPAGHTEARQRLEVFGVLHELGVRAEGSDPFEAVDGRALRQRVVGLRVEAVHGVDDHGHPRRARREPAVHARLRIVRVHDVGAQVPEVAVELLARERVVSDAHRPARVLDRDVPDAVALELHREGAGRRHADDLVAGRAERAELRAEQQLETDVGRGHVNDDGAVAHVVAPR